MHIVCHFILCCYNLLDWVVCFFPVHLKSPSILPVFVKDHACSDGHELQSYMSTYCLHRSFDFNGLLSDRDIHPRVLYPPGDLIVVDVSVALLSEHFPHFTKAQSVALCQGCFVHVTTLHTQRNILSSDVCA